MTPEEYLIHPNKTVVLYPNDVLTKPAETITDLSPWEQIGRIMTDVMIDSNGIGLAAPQVGLSYRAFVIRSPDGSLLYINPEILSTGNQFAEVDEGCLSLPGITIKVNRPKKIKVRWTTFDGKQRLASYEGLMARVFQHELDHLNGLLISRPEK